MKQTNKDKVLAALEAHKGDFVSGGQIAAELGCTRNAIWKAMRALQGEGHAIDSVTGKGYRLDAASSVLSAASIQHYLSSNKISVEYRRSIDSTNTLCKKLAEEGAPEGCLVVAEKQTAGRGRQGRPFSSPAGTGIYFSLLLRPRFDVAEVMHITSYAAVVVAQEIERLLGAETQIKWVNDVFVGGHKVCGILTEASLSAESGTLSHAVLGIGINVFTPQKKDADSGDDDDGQPAYHGISPLTHDSEDLRARLVAGIASTVIEGYSNIPAHSYIDEYRKRSLLDGRDVEVFQGARSYRAHVIGINDDFTLEVELEDGQRKALSCGEVHIPSSQL